VNAVLNLPYAPSTMTPLQKFSCPIESECLFIADNPLWLDISVSSQSMVLYFGYKRYIRNVL
jgi:hypothetical protein